MSAFTLGQPKWFVAKTRGWGIRPVVWQGWVYTFGAAIAIAAPFLFLMLRGDRVPEALIWLAASSGVFVWDVSKILQAIRNPAPAVESAPLTKKNGAPNTAPHASPKDDTFYIGDDDSNQMTGRTFTLNLRK